MGALSSVSRLLAGLGARPGLFLAAILALGFALRAIQARLGLPYVYNFDDPQIASHALNIIKTGDWNPHFFAYGSLMIYVDTIVDALNYLRLAALPLGTHESMFSYDQIKALDTIVMPADGKLVWYWEISHPSFYLWDRYATAALAVGTIWVTYATAQRITPGPAALLPPLILAVLPFHIVHSALTTTDIPAGFMVATATLAAMIFAESGKLSAFITSLLFVGLAAATKYNSALVLVSPALALVIRWGAKQSPICWWHWVLFFAVPAVVFLTAMPFALLDFRTFITDLAQTVSSYHTSAPGSVRPGMRHLRIILGQFGENMGVAGTILALAGLVLMGAAARLRRSLSLLIVFPLLFVAYMSTTSADYHRNFIPIYPFVSLYAGYGLYRLLDWRQVSGRMSGRGRASVAGAIVALAILPMLYGAIANAARVANSRDTRTTAIPRANALSSVNTFEVAAELHVHQFDLDGLNRPWRQAGIQQIMQDICRPAGGTAFILPAEIVYTNFFPATAEETDRIARANALMRTLSQLPDTIAIGGTATATWRPLVSPGILIVHGRSGLCDEGRKG